MIKKDNGIKKPRQAKITSIYRRLQGINLMEKAKIIYKGGESATERRAQNVLEGELPIKGERGAKNAAHCGGVGACEEKGNIPGRAWRQRRQRPLEMRIAAIWEEGVLKELHVVSKTKPGGMGSLLGRGNAIFMPCKGKQSDGKGGSLLDAHRKGVFGKVKE